MLTIGAKHGSSIQNQNIKGMLFLSESGNYNLLALPEYEAIYGASVFFPFSLAVKNGPADPTNIKPTVAGSRTRA